MKLSLYGREGFLLCLYFGIWLVFLRSDLSSRLTLISTRCQNRYVTPLGYIIIIVCALASLFN